jgi:hypothetical protein
MFHICTSWIYLNHHQATLSTWALDWAGALHQTIDQSLMTPIVPTLALTGGAQRMNSVPILSDATLITTVRPSTRV